MTSIHPPVRMAAAGLAAVFALTSCSSSEPSEVRGAADDPAESQDIQSESNVFDFTESSMGPAETIEFRVPDELIEMDQEYAERRILDSVNITATEAKDPSECAIKYDFGYTDTGLARLTEYAEEISEVRPPQEAAFNALTNESPDKTAMEEDYSSAVVQLKCALSPSDDSDTAQARLVYTYDDGPISIGTTSLLLAEVSVMQSGELFVQNVDRRSWQVDSDGNWVKG